MIKIKENNTLIRNFFAMLTGFIKPSVFFSTKFAPIINNTVSGPAHIFFKSTIIQTAHFTISIIWMSKQSISNFYNALESRGIMEFNTFQFFSESLGRFVKVS